MSIRAILSNSSWLLSEKTIRLAVSMLLNVWIARHLAPSGLGALATAQSIALILFPLASFALDGVLIRDLARRPEIARILINRALAIRVAGGLLTTLLGVIVLGFLAPELSGPSRTASIVVLSLGLVNMGEVIETWFLSRLRSAEIVPLRLAAFALASAARVTVLAGDLGLTWIALSLLVEPALTSLLLFFKACRQIPPTPDKSSVPGTAYLLREATPLMLSLLAYQVYTRIDQALVMKRLGATEAGLYAVSTRIIELPMMLSGVLAMSLFPYLARTAEDDPRAALEHYRPWIAAASLASWLGLALLFFFGEWFAGAVFGAHYAAAGHLAFLRGLGLVFFINGFLNSTFITNHGLQRILPWNSALGALCSIPLALLGMRWLGLEGVALAWAFSQCLVLFALNFCWPALRPLARLQAGALVGRGINWHQLFKGRTSC